METIGIKGVEAMDWNAASVVELQTSGVERWHAQPLDNPFEGIRQTICQQHQYNYLLWHQEDIARSPRVTDRELAEVKRGIDRLNQQRNDWIERIDDEIGTLLERRQVSCPPDAPLNTETPGSAMDRLSILALRIYHLREQLDRTDVDQVHRQGVQQKLAIALLQQHELRLALQQLLDDIFAGRKRHRVYRQLKMYNDPTLNPYLYDATLRRAS
jgi:hypothetical protein